MKESIERLNEEIKKYQEAQHIYGEYTAEHLEALKEEIELQKMKMSILKEQESQLLQNYG